MPVRRPSLAPVGAHLSAAARLLWRAHGLSEGEAYVPASFSVDICQVIDPNKTAKAPTQKTILPGTLDEIL